MPIRILTPDVAARIAAGEVVERPASVVKELVENALDAGASRITVEVTGGGVTSIRVTDDGCGIEADELATAFERHATSKLIEDEDLLRILTLGFRGEALPSIAAVAAVEVVSRTAGSEAAAAMTIGPERRGEITSKGAPAGTTVTVRGLFERQPARRAFLRTPASEGGAIARAVSHYALAYPEVRFQLIADGRQSLHTPGSGDLRDAVAAVYGLDVGSAMLDVMGEPGPVVVSGLAGPPELSRSSRSYISIFVNRRWIQNRRLTFAVESAYEGMLMVRRHPIAAINLRVEPGAVDVNVHPTKAEVRFRDESAVFRAVQKAVRAALVTASPVTTGVGAAVRPEAGVPLSLEAPAWTPPLWERAIRREDAREGASAAVGVAPEGARPTPAAALPVLRVIGQFAGVYIITEGPEGMYLIDQHAAHERVLYERFCAERAARRPDVQGLLEPLALDLTAEQRALLAGQAEALTDHGFEIEPFGDGAYLWRSVPASLAGGDLREGLLRFLDVLAEENEGDRRDRVAMSLACHGAIRAGKTLTPEEMRELVRSLEESEAPHTCPHGRPTMVHVSAEMLARGFGRR
ncbi:MAG: DNA mismatch repair endonuclease MutL [Chloroflexi bacterium]|nr:MAG: DNA mismatch repair endonuclease MutL [Chloroflexota bacterium]